MMTSTVKFARVLSMCLDRASLLLQLLPMLLPLLGPPHPLPSLHGTPSPLETPWERQVVLPNWTASWSSSMTLRSKIKVTLTPFLCPSLHGCGTCALPPCFKTEASYNECLASDVGVPNVLKLRHPQHQVLVCPMF